ncbi:uncharacterized protein PG986_001868 [Apiospora aurea]|uniref:Ankyrin n=1 Tax=Apiospora aurea TaxID=335848 RepID=A0ABR1QZ33_9PEZI
MPTLPELPLELHVQIAGFLSKQRDIATLARTNRTMHGFYEQFLYKRGVGRDGSRAAFAIARSKTSTVASFDKLDSYAKNKHTGVSPLQDLDLIRLEVIQTLGQARPSYPPSSFNHVNERMFFDFSGYSIGTVLHWAVAKGKLDFVDDLLTRGADANVVGRFCLPKFMPDRSIPNYRDSLAVDAVEPCPHTPIFLALFRNDLAMCKLLVQAGAALSIPYFYAGTINVIDLAAYCGHASIVKWLARSCGQGPDPKKRWLGFFCETTALAGNSKKGCRILGLLHKLDFYVGSGLIHGLKHDHREEVLQVITNRTLNIAYHQMIDVDIDELDLPGYDSDQGPMTSLASALLACLMKHAEDAWPEDSATVRKLVAELLAKKADPRLFLKSLGMTYMDRALTLPKDTRPILECLLASKIGVNVPNPRTHSTPLGFYLQSLIAYPLSLAEFCTKIRLLVAYGINVDHLDRVGSTALGLACQMAYEGFRQSLSLVGFLLEVGANAGNMAFPARKTLLGHYFSLGAYDAYRVLHDGGCCLDPEDDDPLELLAKIEQQTPSADQPEIREFLFSIMTPESLVSLDIDPKHT